MTRPHSKGLTLIELLVVISILAVLLILSMMSWRKQIDKANDSKRKDHLNRLSIAFEEYYNDKETFPPGPPGPPDNIIENCGGDELSPYLESIPCDPVTNTPYCYVYDVDEAITSFRILTHLQNSTDPDIENLNCHGQLYCGYETECIDYGSEFNYGVTSSNLRVLNPSISLPVIVAGPSPSSSTSPAPSPSSSPIPSWACTNAGVCNWFDDTSTCGRTWVIQSECDAYCPSSTIEERCD